MKTLKRLKNILSGAENKEEEKTETPQGEPAPETKTETTIDKKEETRKNLVKKQLNQKQKKLQKM